MVIQSRLLLTFLILGLSMKASSLQIISRVAKNQGFAQTARSALSMVATTNRPTKESQDSQVEKRNLMEQISAAGLASAAVVAAAAVNSAVG